MPEFDPSITCPNDCAGLLDMGCHLLEPKAECRNTVRWYMILSASFESAVCWSEVTQGMCTLCKIYAWGMWGKSIFSQFCTNRENELLYKLFFSSVRILVRVTSGSWTGSVDERLSSCVSDKSLHESSAGKKGRM